MAPGLPSQLASESQRRLSHDLGVFLREQAVLREFAAASTLPVLELDMSDGDLDAACAAITDWMTATGGLWAPGRDGTTDSPG